MPLHRLKITSGLHKGRVIKSSPLIRPTQEKLRQSVFNAYQHSIEGSTFFDIYAGSGAMGIEAISRGAKKAIFFERSLKVCHIIKENLKELQLLDSATVFTGDALTSLKRVKEKAHFAYIDPPYPLTRTLLPPLLTLLDTSSSIEKGGLILLEEGKHAPFTPPPLNTLYKIESKKEGDTLLHIYCKK